MIKTKDHIAGTLLALAGLWLMHYPDTASKGLGFGLVVLGVFCWKLD